MARGLRLFIRVIRRLAYSGCPCLQNGRVDFGCLPRCLAYHRLLRMPREAGVITMNSAVRGKIRRRSGQSLMPRR
jgi:hypothetical protein